MDFLEQPKTVFIEICTECNSKCKYCHMWMTKQIEGGLTTDEKIRIIQEFHFLNPKGEVVLTGGETMMKYDEFFCLSKKCKELNMICSANTNATYLNENNIENILIDGPKYLVISLDSNIERIHDYTRGVKGCYKHVISTIKRLISLKNEINSSTQIMTNSVLFNENIFLVEDYLAFAEDLGLDGIIFQMLSRTFYNNWVKDYFFDNHFFKDKQRSICQIQKVIDLLDRHPIIKTSKQDFEWMMQYIKNPDFIGEQVCNSHEKNLMINSYGEVQLCFNMKSINNGHGLGNIRDFHNNISEVWLSNDAKSIRRIMEDCRLNCGMLNCHRRN